jgi:hypothetical protein
MLEVIETAQSVAKKSRHVQIDGKALVDFSRRLAAETIEVPSWNSLYHFRGDDEETVSYLLVLDTINFCFWPERSRVRWEIAYQSQTLSGYYGLAAALKNAVHSGLPITEADYWAELTTDQLTRVLGGKGELPLIEKRLESLNELGRVLQEVFDGRAIKLVEAAGRSAVNLVRLLAEKLTSFRDVSEYLDYRVFFYKRAQLFAADLYGAFNGKGWGSFEDIGKLTAFADYKLPQVLRHLEILDYAKDLAQKVDQQVCLEASSSEEVEIRANTIWAVELIRRELESTGRRLNAFEIDWILWNLGQRSEFRKKPYHRTLTIYY